MRPNGGPSCEFIHRAHSDAALTWRRHDVDLEGSMSVALTLRLLVVALAASAAIPASATAAQDEKCGLRVDYPHPSGTTSAQIHTRVESFCRLLPVQSNQVNATSYRSRWFGWERMGSADAGPKATDKLRVTVAVNCEPGTEDRWRTEARGIAVIGGETYTAAAYEENDAPISCRR